MNSLRTRLALVVLMLAFAALAACGGNGGLPRRINPPGVTIQQWQTAPDGNWQITLRVQNYSTVPVRFDRVDAELALDGVGAGSMSVALETEIPGQYAEIFTVSVSPSPAARERLARLAAEGQGFGYRLSGTVATAEPDDRYPLDYSSSMTPVPGVAGQYR
jgi:predicted small lipoprotein YifL